MLQESSRWRTLGRIQTNHKYVNSFGLTSGHADGFSLVLHRIWQTIIFGREVHHLWKVRGLHFLLAQHCSSLPTRRYPYFGADSHIVRVIDGVDSTLDLMERAPVNEKNRPLEEIKLTSVSLPSCIMV